MYHRDSRICKFKFSLTDSRKRTGFFMGKKLWQADKKNKLNRQIEAFETKDDILLDQRLVKYDCLGSIAQAKMLRKINILTFKEFKQLESALKMIANLDRLGKFKLIAGDEDIHTKIESFLVKKCGDIGNKIHTGRSRNDQIATALRLYMKDKLQNIENQINKLIESLQKYSEKHGKKLMPGYTHMQKAMPSSIGLWTGSFIESLKDDLKFIMAVFDIIDKSPLGSAAGYGAPIDLQREYTARIMGFAEVQTNSLYCQNSRGKFEAIVLGAAISILQTLNKLATDVMLFTTSEYGFFNLDFTLTTGSSIMPQKKNPDLAELIRSKLHILLGHYTAVVSLSSNLPSGYNRDFQDSKKPLFESLDITFDCIRMSQILLAGLKPIEAKLNMAMTKDLYAAQEAIKLSFKGVPFRMAYKKIAQKYR